MLGPEWGGQEVGIRGTEAASVVVEQVGEVAGGLVVKGFMSEKTASGSDKRVNQNLGSGGGERWTEACNVFEMEECSPGDVIDETFNITSNGTTMVTQVLCSCIYAENSAIPFFHL